MKSVQVPQTRNEEQWNKELEVHLKDALRDIRYGTVTLVVQDGKVIQIDRSEKIRIR